MITTILIYALCILLGFLLGRMDHRQQQRKKDELAEYIPDERSNWFFGENYRPLWDD